MGPPFGTEELESQRLDHSIGWSFAWFYYYHIFSHGKHTHPVYLSPQMTKHRVTM